MRSPASAEANCRRGWSCAFFLATIEGRLFRMAAAKSLTERLARIRPRSGPILPPKPLMEWHFEQPLEPDTREPARGFCTEGATDSERAGCARQSSSPMKTAGQAENCLRGPSDRRRLLIPGRLPV